MPSQHSVTQPPDQTANKYIHSGRGGAGNKYRVPKTGELSTSLKSVVPVPSSKFRVGRGGAGNIHEASERAVVSLDEELERREREEKKEEESVFHVGRGGAGNWAFFRSESSRKDSSSSGGSNATTGSGFFGRLSNALARR